MRTPHWRYLLGGLASIAVGLFTLPAAADLIAGDGFNYVPLGVSLDTANGGSGSPGWSAGWSADPNATVTPGLTYSGYGGIGIGNGATLGDVNNAAGMSRNLNDPGAVPVLWMRMLYNAGPQVEGSLATATPFELHSANNGWTLDLERTVGEVEEGGAFTLNMVGDTAGSAAFDLSAGTHMLLWKLAIDQTAGQDEALSMWVDPTATTEVDLGAAFATVNGNILEGGDDYLALFQAEGGLGDQIDELAIGTTLGDVTAQLTDPLTPVPEAPMPLMVSVVTLLVSGGVWYRRRQTVRAA